MNHFRCALSGLLATLAGLLWVSTFIVMARDPALVTKVFYGFICVASLTWTITFIRNAVSWLRKGVTSRYLTAGNLFGLGVVLLGTCLLAPPFHANPLHGPGLLAYFAWIGPLLCFHYAYQATKTSHPFSTLKHVPILTIGVFFFLFGLVTAIVNPTYTTGPAPTSGFTLPLRIIWSSLILLASSGVIVHQVRLLVHPEPYEIHRAQGPLPYLGRTNHNPRGPWMLFIASLIQLPVAIYAPINYYLNQRGHLSPANDRAAHYVIPGIVLLVATGLTLSTRRILWERKQQKHHRNNTPTPFTNETSPR